MFTENKLIIGDSAEVLKTFPDKTFDLAILDPPYYKIVKAKWDHQWKSLDEYLKWLEGICLEIKRVLKDNGSLYVFGDDYYIAYVQVMLDKHFTFLNHLVWYKRNNMSIKGAKNVRRYACVSERILFYGLQDQTGLETVMLDTSNFKTLRQYFKDFQEAIGLSLKQINIKLGHRKAEHAFYWGSTQWDLPTPETYAELCNLPLKHEFVRREYEDLRREYEDLRREYEDLRRPFNYHEKVYEVFDVPIIGGKERTEHPTTKPKELYKQLIECSTNPNSLIIDPFAGSGTSLIAAKETNRICVAIEKEEKYIPVIEKRISQVDVINTKRAKKLNEFSDQIIDNYSEFDYETVTVDELETMLDGKDRESYENMLLEIPYESFDAVRKAYWIGKGFINVAYHI